LIQVGEQYNGKLGLYTITKPLKVGGMGEVVEATNQNGEEVVVKFPATSDESGIVHPPRYIRDLEDKLRIEANVLKNFIHSKPNSIVNYIDESNDPNNYFLVMEKVDGETVGQKIAGSNPLSENEIIRLSVDVLHGLEFLHKHNTIYRDMKPSNIMVKKNGSAVLIDFGTAKQGWQRQSTKEHTRLGTAGWTCPDQDIGRASPECDLYGLGRVMYFMATAIQPARFSTTTYRIQQNKKPHNLNSSVSMQLSELVDEMIDPEHNTVHTASGLISKLGSLSTSKPGHSKPKRIPAQRYVQTGSMQQSRIVLEGLEYQILDNALIGKIHDKCERCNRDSEGINVFVGWNCGSGCRKANCNNPGHLMEKHHMRIWKDPQGQMCVVNNDPNRGSAINSGGKWTRMLGNKKMPLKNHDQVALLYNEMKGPYMTFTYYTQ
jgi:serine/threonine protein kinase